MKKISTNCLMLIVLAMMMLCPQQSWADWIYYPDSQELVDKDNESIVINNVVNEPYTTNLIIEGKTVYNQKVLDLTSSIKNNSGSESYSIIVIYPECFESCPVIEEVKLPSSLQEIREGAFKNCTYISKINIPSSVTSIGKNVFEGCKTLTHITIPSSVTSLGEGVFKTCTGLSEVVFEGKPSAGSSLFEGCTALKSIFFSGSEAPSWASSVFDNCDNLETICYTPAGKTSFEAASWPNKITPVCAMYYNATDQILYSGDFTLSNVTADDEDNATNLTIGSNYRTHYSSIDLSTKIVDKNLTEYNITTLGKDCFFENDLQSITFPSTLTTIGDEAFCYSYNLESITIPSTVTSFGDFVFSDCNKLTSVTLPSNITTLPAGIFGDCGKLTTYEIPSSVTTIGEMAFAGSGLTSITIPSKVTTIGDEAFADCSSLTKCKFNGYPHIGKNVFVNIIDQDAGTTEPLADVSYSMNLTDDSYISTDANANFPALINAATYSRTVTSNWGTLVLPYAFSSNDDVQLYQVSAMTDGDNATMEASPVDNVAANTPCLFKKKTDNTTIEFPADDKDFTVSSNPTATPVEGWSFTGTYSELSSQTGMYYIGSDKFWKADNGITIKPFRATPSSNNSNAKTIVINAIDDDSTSILSLDADNNVKESPAYNLSGQRLSAPQKGQINIINGKKTYIK